MKVQIFRPLKTQYGALIAFCEGLKKGFELIGVQSELVIYHERFKRSEITVGFNGPLQHLEEITKRKLLGDIHFSLLVDAPWRFMYLLSDPKIKVGVVDQSYLRFAHRIKDNAYFFPHSVDSTYNYDLTKKRKYPIVMPLSYYPLEDLKVPEGYENWVKTFVDDILNNPDVSYLDYFQRVVEKGMPYEELIKACEERLRLEGQLRVLDSLKGFEVHLFGQGTEKLNRPGFICHGPKTFYELRKVYEESEIVINTSPKMREGGHERIFEAIVAGAKVITDYNPFLDRVFKGQMPFFDYAHLIKLPELFEKPTVNLRDQVLEEFSWKKRAEEIMRIAQE